MLIFVDICHTQRLLLGKQMALVEAEGLLHYR